MASDFSLRHDLAEQSPKCPNRAFCSYRLLGDVKSVMDILQTVFF